MSFRWVLALAILWTCSVAGGAAQESVALPSRTLSLPLLVAADDGPSPAERIRAVEEWTREFDKWRAWHQRYWNQPEPGWFSNRSRRDAPMPPAWLAASCTGVPEEETWLVEGCRAWQQWASNDSGEELLAQTIVQARLSQEAPRHTQWWERVHLDALWPMTQSNSSAFGVAGMHTTFHVTKRFQVFMTPGVILMRVPVVDGGQTWSAATDWGFSYSLTDFTLPGLRRPTTLHFNIARVWILSATGQTTPGEIYLAGLSLSFKQR
jgi:hypothetical protein